MRVTRDVKRLCDGVVIDGAVFTKRVEVCGAGSKRFKVERTGACSGVPAEAHAAVGARFVLTCCATAAQAEEAAEKARKEAEASAEKAKAKRAAEKRARKEDQEKARKDAQATAEEERARKAAEPQRRKAADRKKREAELQAANADTEPDTDTDADADAGSLPSAAAPSRASGKTVIPTTMMILMP